MIWWNKVITGRIFSSIDPISEHGGIMSLLTLLHIRDHIVAPIFHGILFANWNQLWLWERGELVKTGTAGKIWNDLSFKVFALAVSNLRGASDRSRRQSLTNLASRWSLCSNCVWIRISSPYNFSPELLADGRMKVFEMIELFVFSSDFLSFKVFSRMIWDWECDSFIATRLGGEPGEPQPFVWSKESSK